MKTTLIAFVALSIFLATTAATQAGGALACGGTVSAIRDGKKINKITRSIEMINDLQALLQSCSIDTSANASEKKWNELLKSSSYIHFSLPDQFVFLLPLQGDLRADVTEIILPLPKGAWPDNIYVKNKKGYFSYCKYRPDYLKKIVAYPEINLLSESPYSSLADLNKKE
jgi:hypothetical protein